VPEILVFIGRKLCHAAWRRVRIEHISIETRLVLRGRAAPTGIIFNYNSMDSPHWNPCTDAARSPTESLQQPRAVGKNIFSQLQHLRLAFCTKRRAQETVFNRSKSTEERVTEPSGPRDRSNF
jgi:hypothetical protein